MKYSTIIPVNDTSSSCMLCLDLTKTNTVIEINLISIALVLIYLNKIFSNKFNNGIELNLI